jgi:hypothetical protein
MTNMKGRILILFCAVAVLLAGLSGCGGGVGRLAEVENRLDYLTSELAEQRGEIDRIREKLDMQEKGVRP